MKHLSVDEEAAEQKEKQRQDNRGIKGNEEAEKGLNVNNSL